MESTVQNSSLVLEDLEVGGYERVVICKDPSVGLLAIIAIHNSKLGPGLGGTRIYPYTHFDAGLNDALRLAKGMTYKSGMAETGLGGAKSVIFLDPKDKTEDLLLSFGEAVKRLNGTYICAEDMGSTTKDMEIINRVNPYVVGLAHSMSSGDPSPFTAWGVFKGIQATCQFLFNDPSVSGKKIAIQGLGNVGVRLAEHLFWAGAELIVSDIDLEKAERLGKKWGALVVPTEQILSIPCTILAPCALGGILNEKTIPTLQCQAVAGAANNQLLTEKDGERLLERGILYAPDFVINAGGLINVTGELTEEGYQPLVSRKKTEAIYDSLLEIYSISLKEKCPTHQAAVELVDDKLVREVGKRDTEVFFPAQF